MNPQAEAARQGGVRMITVENQRLRVAIHPGNGSRTPLLMMNGVGVNLELLQPFVDELDPAREIIRFDVPGIGGSPMPAIRTVFHLWPISWRGCWITWATRRWMCSASRGVAHWPSSLPCSIAPAADSLSWPALQRGQLWSPAGPT